MFLYTGTLAQRGLSETAENNTFMTFMTGEDPYAVTLMHKLLKIFPFCQHLPIFPTYKRGSPDTDR